MLTFRQGDIIGSDSEAVVNTVNCVGVMGRGIALQFKNAYPENFEAYAAACHRHEVQPGRMFVFETGRLGRPRFIINFPTKRHWRGKSRLEDIESGLRALVVEVRARGIGSISIPPLGSGLGGLAWMNVKPLVERAARELPEVEVVVFEPGHSPAESKANRSTEVPAMTAGRAALVTLMDRYLAALMDPTITLLEVHKLIYFLQAAGEPLRLRFVKAPLGPYAENLRHVLRHVEGHFVSGYADGGDSPTKELTLVPGAAADAEKLLAAQEATQARLQRVTRLVDGFETPFGLELLATVHWVVVQEQAHDLEATERATYAWGSRKAQFSRRQIDLAFERLSSEGWLMA
ncbi:MAG: macro domain-containing protein [Dehalococcoidales bacterium]|nr:macro domain-containing protein [Dehalococcoidales bacterium]